MTPRSDRAPLTAAAWIAAVVLVVAVRPAGAEPVRVTLDPAQTTIRWRLPGFPDTVHGTFKLDRGELGFDPATGAADGCIRVDARSGESGNGSRDHRMHDEILESARYPFVTFHPTRLVGKYPAPVGGTMQLDGALSFRNVEHPVTLPVRLTSVDGLLAADASTAIPYVAWGL